MQASLLPSMTVCPKYDRAYKEEELARHGIGSLEVSKHIILYLNMSQFLSQSISKYLNSRNTVEETSKETPPRMNGKYLRMWPFRLMTSLKMWRSVFQWKERTRKEKEGRRQSSQKISRQKKSGIWTFLDALASLAFKLSVTGLLGLHYEFCTPHYYDA